MLERARQRLVRARLTHRALLVRGDIRHLPFRSDAGLRPGDGAVRDPAVADPRARSRQPLSRRLRAWCGRAACSASISCPTCRGGANIAGGRVCRGARTRTTTVTLVESVRQDRRRKLTIFDQEYIERRGRERTVHRFALTFRTLSVPQMARRLERGGFSIEAILGDYQGGPWDERADVWIILAEEEAVDMWKHSPDVVFRDLEGEAVILDLASGTYFGLNEVGTRVWRMVDEGRDAAADRRYRRVGVSGRSRDRRPRRRASARRPERPATDRSRGRGRTSVSALAGCCWLDSRPAPRRRPSRVDDRRGTPCTSAVPVPLRWSGLAGLRGRPPRLLPACSRSPHEYNGHRRRFHRQPRRPVDDAWPRSWGSSGGRTRGVAALGLGRRRADLSATS